MDKKQIVGVLEEIASLLELKGEDKASSIVAGSERRSELPFPFAKAHTGIEKELPPRKGRQEGRSSPGMCKMPARRKRPWRM